MLIRLALAAACTSVLTATSVVPVVAAAPENVAATPEKAAAEKADSVPPALESPAPVGANDFSCKPTAAHPRPVVLVHGLGATSYENWAAFSPLLKSKGYCVFALTYGTTAAPFVGGLRPMEQSAEQLSMFVDKVRAAAGVDKVDIVGHSEGGIMPRYYLKNLGGAAKVGKFVAWAPPNHGTSLSGINALAQALPEVAEFLVPPLCPSCLEFLTGSDFLKKLNAGDETIGDVQYTVLTTRYDFVVTPHTTGYLNGDHVKNITIQNVNPFDIAEHVAMAFDPTTFDITLKTLAKN
jgi:triacylglycerol esterase/lipase EstA (alpha/beta hydrolase family)